MWGLIIALVATALTVLVATLTRSNKKASLISWGVVAVGFLALWFISARMVRHIETRSQLKEATMSLTTLTGKVMDETGLTALMDEVGLGDLGLPSYDKALAFYTKRIWLCVIALVVVAAAMGLGFALFMQGSGRGGGLRSSSDEGYSTRSQFEDF